MFKIVCIGLFFFAASYGAQIQQFDNVLDYNEARFRGLAALPYAYQDDYNERVFVKPVVPEVLLPSVPAVAAVGVSKLGLIAKVASTALAVVKKTFAFIVAKAPALIIGSLVAFGICKLTPICAKLDSVKSLLAVPLEIRSYASPERLARASEFVKTAIRKYRSLQGEL